MFLALAVSLAVVPALQTEGSTPAPQVQLSLNSDGEFRLGEKPRVSVRVEEDGYLVVLHADRDGRVRVLFPLEPADDDFVRGDRELEVRGRNGRHPFFLDYEGDGIVLAARSADPFSFEPFVRGDHWDYRALGGANRDAVRDDPEAALLEIVRRMAGQARFDYDVVPYTVSARYANRYGYHPYGNPYGSRFSFGLSFGYPYRYSFGFYRPFYYRSYFDDPFCYDPFWGYDPYCYGGGFYSTGFYPRRYYYGGGWGGGRFGYPVRISTPYSRRFVSKSQVVVPRAVEPRRRFPSSESFGTRSSAPPRERRIVEPRGRGSREGSSVRPSNGGGRRTVREGSAVRPRSSGGSVRQSSRGNSGGSRPASRPSSTSTRRRR